MKSYDFAIIGGGIVGLAIARQILLQNPRSNVVVFEKELGSAKHASGRNSGVLHAGFYYSPDSLKAQLTKRGNALLTEFIQEHDLPFRKTGKVVVAQSHDELTTLQTLYERGLANGVTLEFIDEEQLRKIEPYAKTVERALWSPNTSVGDPTLTTEALAQDAIRRGVKIAYGSEVQKVTKDKTLFLASGDFAKAGHVINCAGLYADRFASMVGMNDNYVMMPFKGLYWYAPSLKDRLRSHIYPVPSIENPFLGVHFTTTVRGDVKVGPTAIPSLWREDYGGFSGFSAKEIAQTLSSYPTFLLSKHHNVPRLISSEVPKYIRKYLLKTSQALAPSIDLSAFTQKGRPGVRAQLMDRRTGKLEMDFVLRGSEDFTHVLNAVSPAWTSSLAVAEHVVSDMSQRNVI